MNRRTTCSDEELHRFVDGELSDGERTFVSDLLEQNPQLADRVMRYRMTDDLLRQAFNAVDAPIRPAPRQHRGRVLARAAAAAALFVPLGFLAGWLARPALDGHGHQALLSGGTSLGAPAGVSVNALFHIDADDPAAMEEVLDRVESLLANDDGPNARIEVVANAGGLNLLRADNSAYAERLRAMLARYPNLTIVACANTIKRFAERGTKVRLIGDVRTDETAVDHIVQRLQQGWTYIKL